MSDYKNIPEELTQKQMNAINAKTYIYHCQDTIEQQQSDLDAKHKMYEDARMHLNITACLNIVLVLSVVYLVMEILK
jgi:hypothetical protein